ncbi:unnamed protein product [Enterobius vermicularis]|uniref:Carboxypeptidase n=1 Tax=Enterobius vermicularis TaxID=51028 RepID=A0A0N4UX97_ENTVE|nr:unnamed protein product [Enterobius vermicularis]
MEASALRFVESQNDVARDPVILWLSGGPGCSSLFALFTEIGPYLVTTDGQNLVENLYSWNKIANLLFFESPVGVGFSYVSDDVVSNDDTACTDNYAALIQFFEEFPQFKENDFYVTGESYAGVYIPMLVDKILENYEQHPINIKGLVIGNGVLDPDLRHNTFISYAYYHGFIDESAWERAKDECCDGDIDECDFTQYTSGFCKYFFDKTHHDARRNQPDIDYVRAAAEQLTCMGVKAVAIFMNREDVRDALLVPRSARPWRSCGTTIRYQKIYRSMEDKLKSAINSGLKVLLHYGDLDLVCNFIHGEKFARNLGYGVTQPKMPFAVDGKHAGFITKYGDLEVVIVHVSEQYKVLINL